MGTNEVREERKEMSQPKNECKLEPCRSLCPLAGFAECRGESCMLWDDNWQVCSLSSGSLYSGVRVAVCDAAVEVIGHYGDRFGDDRR